MHWPMAVRVKAGRDWSLCDKTALEIDGDVTIEETWNVSKDYFKHGTWDILMH